MRFARGAMVLLMVAPLVSGCHVFRNASAKACHGPQPYQKATTVAPLKIPSGLDAPDTTNALRLPALNEPPPPPRKGRDPCLDEPPPFKVTQPATKTPQA
ncbi:MAG: hypothetical protein JO184_05310 [Gammaproteobacteria bacterium]|nr:hypothetical protein [Gammaproteobacteria bacterium]MBV8404998.1 hypothetical protein [Gammaproteobacteria bacterium]